MIDIMSSSPLVTPRAKQLPIDWLQVAAKLEEQAKDFEGLIKHGVDPQNRAVSATVCAVLSCLSSAIKEGLKP